LAEQPTVDEVLEQIEQRRREPVGLAQAAEDLDEELAGHRSSSTRRYWRT
jgi:hypothetical protein